VGMGGDGHIVLWREIRRRIERGNPPHGIGTVLALVPMPQAAEQPGAAADAASSAVLVAGTLGVMQEHPEAPGRVFIVVHPAFRRNGFGRLLLSKIEDFWDPAIGLEAVVAASNIPSRALFRYWRVVRRTDDQLLFAWPPGQPI